METATAIVAVLLFSGSLIGLVCSVVYGIVNIICSFFPSPHENALNIVCDQIKSNLNPGKNVVIMRQETFKIGNATFSLRGLDIDWATKMIKNKFETKYIVHASMNTENCATRYGQVEIWV